MPMEGEGEDTVVYHSTQSSNFLCENSFPFPKNPFPVLHRVLVLLFFGSILETEDNFGTTSCHLRLQSWWQEAPPP